MFRHVVAATVMAATVAGCGRVAESRFNPLNWFGSDTPVAAVAAQDVADPRPLVDQVIALRIDATPGGAILTATGLPPRQGHWDAGLISVPSEAGTRAYQFRLSPPPGPARISTPQSRQVTVALSLTDRDLSGIRTIRVEGARSARAVAR